MFFYIYIICFTLLSLQSSLYIWYFIYIYIYIYIYISLNNWSIYNNSLYNNILSRDHTDSAGPMDDSRWTVVTIPLNEIAIPNLNLWGLFFANRYPRPVIVCIPKERRRRGVGVEVRVRGDGGVSGRRRWRGSGRVRRRAWRAISLTLRIRGQHSTSVAEWVLKAHQSLPRRPRQASPRRPWSCPWSVCPSSPLLSSPLLSSPPLLSSLPITSF